MQQNTPEWLKWRSKGIGASDATVIMGTCPYKTLLQLWEEKCQPQTFDGKEDKSKDFIHDKGHRLETKARFLYEITEGISMPTDLMEFGQWDIARCSMDGFNKELNQGIEIKYVGKKEFTCIRDEKKIPENKKHFYAQIQHQYMVSGAAEIELVAYNDEVNAIAVLSIPCDVPYIKKMLEAEKIFWEMVQTKSKPELGDGDAKKVKNQELKDLISKYQKAQPKLKELETTVKALRGDILGFLENNPDEDHPLLISGNTKISESIRLGVIDYKKAFEFVGKKYNLNLNGLDFSEFMEVTNFEGAFNRCKSNFDISIDLNEYKSPDKTSKTFKVSVKKSTAKKPKKAKAK